MRILGISDGWEPSVTLVEDDVVVARVVQSGITAFGVPWLLVKKILADAQIASQTVQKIAVAGRFTPTFAERMGRDVAPPGMLYQALLGARRRDAWASYKVQDWFAQQFAREGFSNVSVRMVDMHTALAKGSYISQSLHRALTIVVEPNVDGLSISVNRGIGQQIDRVWSQKSDAAFNDYFSRLFLAVEADFPRDVVTVLSSEGVAEPHLVQLLAQRFSCHGAGVKQHGQGDVYRGLSMSEAIRGVDVATARASIFKHLSAVLAGFVAHHVHHNQCSDVTLAGAVFSSGELVREIGKVTDVSTVWAPAISGLASLGAAVEAGGLGPQGNEIVPVETLVPVKLESEG